MKRSWLLLFSLLLLAWLASPAAASPIASGTPLSLSSHPDGNQAPPFYGLRLDGLEGDESEEFTFNFSDPRSDMTLFYDAGAGTITIEGVTWGGEDIGTSYAGGGSLWAVSFVYDGVMDLGDRLEVAPPLSGQENTGTITNLVTNEVYDLVDFAGSHSYSFRCVDEHRGEGPACYGWLNHSGVDLGTHVYASDWLFVVGQPIPEPSAALLFGFGSLVVGAGVRRKS